MVGSNLSVLRDQRVRTRMGRQHAEQRPLVVVLRHFAVESKIDANSPRRQCFATEQVSSRTHLEERWISSMTATMYQVPLKNPLAESKRNFTVLVDSFNCGRALGGFVR
jgi:hypothetical protein